MTKAGITTDRTGPTAGGAQLTQGIRYVFLLIPAPQSERAVNHCSAGGSWAQCICRFGLIPGVGLY